MGLKGPVWEYLAGYGGTTRTDPDQTANLPPLNRNAHCAAPAGSSTDVRGAQHAPQP